MFYPKFRFRRITRITPEWLMRHDISVLLMDVDNTLTTHGSQNVSTEVIDWVKLMHAQQISLFILSNNSERRVKPLADQLGVGYISRAAKPLGFSARKGLRQMGLTGQKAALVGDQIFTDVLCANLAGMTSILVDPFESEKHWGFRFKRKLERFVLEKRSAFEEGKE